MTAKTMYLFKSESFATEQDAIDTEETIKSTKTHELFSLKVRTLLVHNDVFVLKVKKAFNVSLFQEMVETVKSSVKMTYPRVIQRLDMLEVRLNKLVLYCIVLTLTSVVQELSLL